MLSFDDVILLYMEICDFSNVQLYGRAVRTISSNCKTDIGIIVDDLFHQKMPYHVMGC